MNNFTFEVCGVADFSLTVTVHCSCCGDEMLASNALWVAFHTQYNTSQVHCAKNQADFFYYVGVWVGFGLGGGLFARRGAKSETRKRAKIFPPRILSKFHLLRFAGLSNLASSKNSFNVRFRATAIFSILTMEIFLCPFSTLAT